MNVKIENKDFISKSTCSPQNQHENLLNSLFDEELFIHFNFYKGFV